MAKSARDIVKGLRREYEDVRSRLVTAVMAEQSDAAVIASLKTQLLERKARLADATGEEVLY